MPRPPFLIAFLVLSGCSLVGWNASRFIDAKPQVRMKDLDFLPSADAARMIALGHTNTAAKLRWIDSFAYFELQLDRKDDTVASTGESAFERLYRMLVALDPHFLPFYQHASLNLGGVLGHHGKALSLLEGGLLDLPHETTLWRMIATELAATDKAEERNAVLLESVLSAWRDAETTDEGRQQVWDWKKAMARRQYLDLRQLPYWEEQLRETTSGSANRDFILNTMREQIARYGITQLTLVVDTYAAMRGSAPADIDSLLAEDVLRSAWPQGIPTYAPVSVVDGTLRMRPDPFGYPYTLLRGKPVSPGWSAHQARQRTTLMNVGFTSLATKLGYWPDSLAGARAVGLELDELPPGCHWKLEGKAITFAADPPPFPAWEPPTK